MLYYAQNEKIGCHGIMEIPIRNEMTRDKGEKYHEHFRCH